jgi:hypothetical protein
MILADWHISLCTMTTIPVGEVARLYDCRHRQKLPLEFWTSIAEVLGWLGLKNYANMTSTYIVGNYFYKVMMA